MYLLCPRDFVVANVILKTYIETKLHTKEAPKQLNFNLTSGTGVFL